MSDNDILKTALKQFKRAEDNESDNRKAFREDIRFARLSDQWPDTVKKQRESDQRPCLTINKVAPVIRQVVNDSRQNRPAITVRPVDSQADKDTAEIITGLIRNIEQTSDADIAYDTAIDNAVSGGFGYFRVNLDFANDIDPAGDLTQLDASAFEKDIKLERIVNPLSVYGDPDSTSASSDDWNVAFVTEDMTHEAFKARWPKANLDSFQGTDEQRPEWINEKSVRVAEYWTREKTEKAIIAVAYPDETTAILALEDFEKRQQEIAALGGQPIGPPRAIPSWKVTQRFITGTQVLETNDWLGKYIPIIPVYGDEVYCEGQRYLRSIIRDAKDANRMFNYGRTTPTELVALAPIAPWIIEEDALVDEDKWDTANKISHSYLEYRKGAQKPERNPFSSIPAGALQEALNAADDIKSTTGIYDASLGAKSNETSGRAIMARQREGDVSSFHFIDNLTRSIRHAGRVVLDLIPKVYSTPRMIRVLGEDGEANSVPINGMMPGGMDEQSQAAQKVYDLRVGRYDLAVTAGPSFTTRREETATQMIEMIRAYPDAAPVIGDLLAKNLDWPGADEIADRLKALAPPGMNGDGPSPEAQENMMLKQQIQQMAQEMQRLQDERDIKARDQDIDAFEAETNRIQAMQPEFVPTQPP
ncbi:MAG: hypothetical protein E6Q97_05550 [Desulfurellales bacterium]|nr:MAG: hypothetical protein E6Q97_05550 [Desulfurellales bacterium]